MVRGSGAQSLLLVVKPAMHLCGHNVLYRFLRAVDTAQVFGKGLRVRRINLGEGCLLVCGGFGRLFGLLKACDAVGKPGAISGVEIDWCSSSRLSRSRLAVQGSVPMKSGNEQTGQSQVGCQEQSESTGVFH